MGTPRRQASVERTPEINEFEETQFGPYPFEAQGGIVTGVFEFGFALENQTRPVYDAAFFTRGSNTYVVAHENAHQRISGQQFDELFTTWLYTPGKPAAGPNGALATRTRTEPKSYRKMKETHELLTTAERTTSGSC